MTSVAAAVSHCVTSNLVVHECSRVHTCTACTGLMLHIGEEAWRIVELQAESIYMPYRNCQVNVHESGAGPEEMLWGVRQLHDHGCAAETISVALIVDPVPSA